MYRYKSRFFFAVLFLLLLSTSAQATNLQISVQDNLDNTSIPHATVFVNGINQGRTTNNGTFLFPHSGLNDLNVRVSMTGYDNWEQSVNRNQSLLLVNLSRQTLTLKVSLFDTDTLRPVSGAIVNLSAENNTQVKQADSNGTAIFGVHSVTLYSVFITAPNYQSRSETVDMGTSSIEVQYPLLSGNRYSILVQDKDTKAAVPEAEISIDTVLNGKTDSRGILTTTLTREKAHIIEVRKAGYQTFTETKQIGTAEALETIEIAKAPVGAFIYVTDEDKAGLSGADIYINGTLAGTTNQYGRSNFPTLLSGSYPVEVRKTGYVSVARTIDVSNQGQDYVFELPFESADLTIFVQDKDLKVIPNATIAVNGNAAGVSDDHGQYVMKVKLNTLYNITGSKENYQSASTTARVMQGNSTGSVTIILEKNLDWGLIMLIALGAVAVLVLFAAIRMFGHRKRRHVMRKNEI
jgi:uncharacterized membrane protein (UPF0136 family)